MRVWIINHYAIPPSMGGLVRHYYFSKYLQEKGHKVKIFTSSQIHNTDINMIEDKSLFLEKEVDGIEYTFVRTSGYKGNNLSRIINMLQFPIRVWKACKKFEKPDVIYTSSPDPLTAVSAVLMAKKLRCPKVVEIRDLWPESIVEYNGVSRKNPLVLILYQLEKWLYKNADRIVFTFPNGVRYIEKKGWDKVIDICKIHYVCNGVDLQEFKYNAENVVYRDADLDDAVCFKVVYTGSVRKVNNLGMVLECAKQLQSEENIKFLIWGDGTEKDELIEKAEKENITNIVFKGKVEKKYIPSILSRADVNFMHGGYNEVVQYGCSPNKLFEYFAAGRPILSDLNTEYDRIAEAECGLKADARNADEIVGCIRKLYQMAPVERKTMGENAKVLAEQYDYAKLSLKIEKVLLSLTDIRCVI